MKRTRTYPLLLLCSLSVLWLNACSTSRKKGDSNTPSSPPTGNPQPPPDGNPQTDINNLPDPNPTSSFCGKNKTIPNLEYKRITMPTSSYESLLILLAVSPQSSTFIDQSLMNNQPQPSKKPAYGYHVSLLLLKTPKQVQPTKAIRKDALQRISGHVQQFIHNYTPTPKGICFPIEEVHPFPNQYKHLPVATTTPLSQKLKTFQKKLYDNVEAAIISEGVGGYVSIDSLSTPQNFVPHVTVYALPFKANPLSPADFTALISGVDSRLKDLRKQNHLIELELEEMVVRD